ncbi:MAG: hypothetical protein U0350_36480 [Caldilineaceae bacterium]
MDSNIWAFVGLIGILVVLAFLLAHACEERDEAIRANKFLHADNAQLRRHLDRRNHQLGNLVVENYEQGVMLKQAYERGYIPQQLWDGRQN